MKIKGSLKNLSAKKIIALFCCGGVLFLGLRAYQTLKLIDPESGFFTDKNNITVMLFFALTAVLTLITPVLLYLAPLSTAPIIEPKKNIIHGLASLALGLCAGYNAYELIKAPDEGSKTVLALMCASALSCIVLIADAAGFFSNGSLIQKLKIPNLVPVLWALFLTVSNFSVTVSYLNNTVLLINIFADAFLMLFLFQYAKKFSGINGEGNSPVFIYSALMCALLELSAFVSSVIMALSKSSAASFFAVSPYRLFTALFCITALIAMLKNKAPDFVPVSEDDEVIKTAPFEPMPEEDLKEAEYTENDEA